MRLFRVIVPVTDINEIARFYEGLIGRLGQHVSTGRHYIECERTIWRCYFAVTNLEEAESRVIAAGVEIDFPNRAPTMR
jgi:hypothetical protein